MREDIGIGEDTLFSPRLPALPSPPLALMRALPGTYLSAAALCGLARTKHPCALCLYHAHPPGNCCPNLAVGGRDQQKESRRGKRKGWGNAKVPATPLRQGQDVQLCRRSQWRTNIDSILAVELHPTTTRAPPRPSHRNRKHHRANLGTPDGAKTEAVKESVI